MEHRGTALTSQSGAIGSQGSLASPGKPEGDLESRGQLDVKAAFENLIALEQSAFSLQTISEVAGIPGRGEFQQFHENSFC